MTSGTEAGVSEPFPIPLRAFFRPPVIVELILGLSPLAGIAYWHWDAFLVLMLHLLALAISSLFLLLRIATLSQDAILYMASNVEQRRVGAAGLRCVFLGFAVVVLGLGFLILFVIVTDVAGKAWMKPVHGIGDVWRQIVVATGLWIPLACALAWEAVSFAADVVLPRLPFTRRFRVPLRSINSEYKALSPELKAFLYVRAFVTLRMIVTTLALGVGLFLAQLIGPLVLVVLLVGLKTAVAVFLGAGATVDAENQAQRIARPVVAAGPQIAPGKAALRGSKPRKRARSRRNKK